MKKYLALLSLLFSFSVSANEWTLDSHENEAGKQNKDLYIYGSVLEGYHPTVKPKLVLSHVCSKISIDGEEPTHLEKHNLILHLIDNLPGKNPDIITKYIDIEGRLTVIVNSTYYFYPKNDKWTELFSLLEQETKANKNSYLQQIRKNKISSLDYTINFENNSSDNKTKLLEKLYEANNIRLTFNNINHRKTIIEFKDIQNSNILKDYINDKKDCSENYLN